MLSHWKKLGRVWETHPIHDWMVSYAANPVAEQIEGNHFRVYFNCRNAKNVSSIASFDLDLEHPTTPFNLSESPVISPGPIGSFDDSGASMGCIVKVGEKRYLYYLGWNLGVTVPWRNSIGLAISEGLGQPFIKVSMAPVLDRNPVDPFSLSYPWVIHDPSSGCWRMWYGSNLKWGLEQESMAHVIKYAESTDGVHWLPTGRIALDFKSEDEYAISKPCVIYENQRYRMWYAYRGNRYRIGYAESVDGLQWQRLDDQAGIDVSLDGWDSEMVCYPNVFICQGKKYLLYNGNDYGKSGIGLAVEA